MNRFILFFALFCIVIASAQWGPGGHYGGGPGYGYGRYGYGGYHGPHGGYGYGHGPYYRYGGPPGHGHGPYGPGLLTAALLGR
uniref:Neuropeptide-like protein 31 n=1 Tax=Heterorhabditis bacteriophora TaxID=37862 RepID=A0A1I7XKW5_HETBA